MICEWHLTTRFRKKRIRPSDALTPEHRQDTADILRPFKTQPPAKCNTTAKNRRRLEILPGFRRFDNPRFPEIRRFCTQNQRIRPARQAKQNVPGFRGTAPQRRLSVENCRPVADHRTSAEAGALLIRPVWKQIRRESSPWKMPGRCSSLPKKRVVSGKQALTHTALMKSVLCCLTFPHTTLNDILGSAGLSRSLFQCAT